jgi:hypothetical protein
MFREVLVDLIVLYVVSYSVERIQRRRQTQEPLEGLRSWTVTTQAPPEHLEKSPASSAYLCL